MHLKLSSLNAAFKAISYNQRNALICLMNLWLLVAGLGSYWLDTATLIAAGAGLGLGYHWRAHLLPYQLAKFLQSLMPISLLMISSNASWSWVFQLYMLSIVVATTMLIAGRFFNFMEGEAGPDYKKFAIIGLSLVAGLVFALPRFALIIALVLPLIHTWFAVTNNSLQALTKSLRASFPWQVALLLVGLWLLPTPLLLPHLLMVTAIIWLTTRMPLEVFATTFPALLIASYCLGFIITPLQTAALEHILSDYGWISAFMLVNIVLAFYQAQPKVIYSSKNLSRRIEILDQPMRNIRKLSHNGIVHSVQSLDPNYLAESCIDYCHLNGPWGVVKAYLDKHKLSKWLMLGLGGGNLLQNSQPEQDITIIELDPEIIDLASNPRYFSFVSQAKAKVTIHNAEGRNYIDNMPAKEKYDAIILDAYSGRNVPSQVLTVQALEKYFKHIKEGGAVVAHITGMKATARKSLAANLAALKLEAILFSRNDIDNNSGSNEPPIRRWIDKMADRLLTKEQRENLSQILGLHESDIEYFRADWLVIGRKLKDIDVKALSGKALSCNKFLEAYPPTSVVNDEDVGYINL